LFCFDKRIGSKSLILENSKRLSVKPKFIFEEDINNTFNTKNLSSFEKPNRLLIGGCDKKTKLQIINKVGADLNIMKSDTEFMRKGKPWFFTNLSSGLGVEEITQFLESHISNN